MQRCAKTMLRINLRNKCIGPKDATYFIADISANHDGSLERAKRLIRLAAESGANAAKFQNFMAHKIVSKHGFSALKQLSHQAKWKKSVYQVYEEAALPWEWTPELKAECDSVGIDYFSTPYDLEAIRMLDPYVQVFKIGSGDITWPEMLEEVARKGKPVILATGASSLCDVHKAVHTILPINTSLILMQCNTNYTGSIDNFKYTNLNVLTSYHVLFPDVILGLSDHTPGHAAVLGAVALGARVIEKHFTDDNNRDGPDHSFSMTPSAWKDMVDRTRELEWALGSSDKIVTENEKETVIIQRRCLRASKDIKAGTIVTREFIDILRPAPVDSISPYDLDYVIGNTLRRDISVGDYFKYNLLEK